MPTIAFGALAYSNQLLKGGFTREQAEAMAEANVEALKEMMATQQLATRQDLEKVRISLEHSIATTRQDLEKSIASIKHETLKWVMGMLIAQTTLTITAFAIGFLLLK